MDIVILDHAKAMMTFAIAECATKAAIPVLPRLHLDPQANKSTVDEADGVYDVEFIDKTLSLGPCSATPGAFLVSRSRSVRIPSRSSDMV